MCALRITLVGVMAATTIGCGEPLPPRFESYEASCIRMTAEEVPPYPDDPHYGFKHVYACEVEAEHVGEPPYPDGTVILKTSRQEEHTHPYLIATAEKVDGQWRWAEYMRNFEWEPFLKLPISEQVCTDCHAAVSDSLDWIFTGLEAE